MLTWLKQQTQLIITIRSTKERAQGNAGTHREDLQDVSGRFGKRDKGAYFIRSLSTMSYHAIAYQAKRSAHSKSKELEAGCVALDQANQSVQAGVKDKEKDVQKVLFISARTPHSLSQLSKAKDKLDVSAQKSGSVDR